MKSQRKIESFPTLLHLHEYAQNSPVAVQDYYKDEEYTTSTSSTRASTTRRTTTTSRFVPIPNEPASDLPLNLSNPIPLPTPNDAYTEDDIKSRERLTHMYDMATWQMYIR
jgi:hypothetical protein